MRIDGEWLRCADGEVRPVIRGAVVAFDGSPVASLFLVDTGADRTVLSKDVLDALGLPPLSPSERVEGVGGMVASVDVETEIRLNRDSAGQVAFRGRYAAVIDPALLDLPVLGRDITGLFALIVDRPGDTICLLSQRHRYSISTT